MIEKIVYEPLIGNIVKQIELASEKFSSTKNWISIETNPTKIFDHIDDYVNKRGRKIIHISSSDQHSNTLKLKGVELNPVDFATVYIPQGKDVIRDMIGIYSDLIGSLKTMQKSKYLNEIELSQTYTLGLNSIKDNLHFNLPEKIYFENGLTFIANCSDEDALLILLQFYREKRQTKEQYLIVLDNVFHVLKNNRFLHLLYKCSRPYGFSIAVTGHINQYEKDNGVLYFSELLVSDKGLTNFSMNESLKFEFIQNHK